MDKIEIDEKLIEYNALGLIPGPKETLTEFLKRAEWCLQLHEELSKVIEIPEDLKNKTNNNQTLFQDVKPITDDLFGMTPLWTPIIFSNHKLPFWQGGCAWIFQFSEKTPIGAFFQLRETFKNNTTYLKIYEREELIAHESAHIGRMTFEEPQFEEIIAFQSAKTAFRRFFGPFFSSSNESLFFLLTLFLLVVVMIFIPPFIYLCVASFFALLIIGTLKVTSRQLKFQKCLSTLLEIVKERKKAMAIAFRLTDSEIISFAKFSPEELLNYVNEQNDLRWQLIAAVYFKQVLKQ